MATGCGSGEPAADAALEERVERLVASLSLDDKLHQMSGDLRRLPDLITRAVRYNAGPFPAGDDPENGIPPLLFGDGPRGVVFGRSTAFPVSMARGASWDPDLEERVGDAIGVELRSHGANLFGGVCVNLLRHPAWGRAQETYGEDPHHVGEMGAALVRGVQRHAMACVKHYACNSIENSRFKVDVRVDERTLREVYLPHFRRCVDEGVAVVMTAYNRVNGQRCGHHVHLNRDILKGDWGFRGFTLSDFVFGVRDGVAGVRGGLDVEMPVAWRYRRGRLKRAIRRGDIPMAFVDDAVRRVIRTKLRFAAVGEPERYGPVAIASERHRALAREAAARSMVLLRNEPASGPPVLPLDLDRLGSAAVVGPLADVENIGDRGSSMVSPPAVVTPLAGLRAVAADGRTRIVHARGEDPDVAAEAARHADVAIVVVGYTHRDEGEYVFAWGGDRSSLRLPAAHERLIAAVAAANPATVVVIVAGSAVVTEPWRHDVAAIVVSWYAGMEGGHALADLLTGAVDFTGRLPCVFPRRADDLPAFDASARRVSYGQLHGYRHLQATGRAAAYPFGYGLSYTTFEHGPLEVASEEVARDGVVRAALEVENTGARAGEEVVQLYVGYDGSAVRRAPSDLRGFQRVGLAAGERRPVTFEVPVDRLANYDVAAARWEVEPITYRIGVGPSSDPSTHRTATVRVRPARPSRWRARRRC